MMGQTLIRFVFVLLLVSSGAMSCSLWGKKETVVTIDQVPAVVRTSIEKTTAGGKIKKIEKIESDGKVTYEVEYDKDGKAHETYFAEDGKYLKGAKF